MISDLSWFCCGIESRILLSDIELIITTIYISLIGQECFRLAFVNISMVGGSVVVTFDMMGMAGK